MVPWEADGAERQRVQVTCKEQLEQHAQKWKRDLQNGASAAVTQDADDLHEIGGSQAGNGPVLLKDLKYRIDKDVVRTDRESPFYKYVSSIKQQQPGQDGGEGEGAMGGDTLTAHTVIETQPALLNCKTF